MIPDVVVAAAETCHAIHYFSCDPTSDSGSRTVTSPRFPIAYDRQTLAS